MRHYFIFILLSCVGNFVFATQFVNVAEQKTHLVKISAKEMTRISLSQGKIRRLDYVEGDLELIRDDEAGAYLVMAKVKKPINVFVTSSSGQSHALVLQPEDIPLEQIILQEPKSPSPKLTKLEQTGMLETIVKQLTLSMARAKPIHDFTLTSINKLVYIDAEVQWILLNTYKGLAVTGEHYVLGNLTAQTVEWEESQLYQSGVLSVAIENPKLQPWESTNVYVIKSNYEY